jgi:hypothetical protein
MGDKFESYSYRSSYSLNFATENSSMASMANLNVVEKGEVVLEEESKGWKEVMMSKITGNRTSLTPIQKEKRHHNISDGLDPYGFPKGKSTSNSKEARRADKEKQRVYDLSAFGKREKRFLGREGGKVIYVNQRGGKRITEENIPLYAWKTGECRVWIGAVLACADNEGTGNIPEPRRFRKTFGLGLTKNEDKENTPTEEETKKQKRRKKMVMRYKGDGMLLYDRDEASWIKMFGEYEAGHRIWIEIVRHRNRFQDAYDEWDKMVSGRLKEDEEQEKSCAGMRKFWRW